MIAMKDGRNSRTRRPVRKIATVPPVVKRLLKEERLPLVDARKLFASKPKLQTLLMWAYDGYRGKVRLETYREGRTTMTTRQAVERFILAIQGV
jgi:hypothetical protein